MPNIARDILQGWDVLIVEDDPVNLDVARLILDSYGANVFSAMNGKEALEQLKTVHPRFILCDLSMPVMDGWEFIDIIKKERDLLNIPIFAITAHAMVGDRVKALNAGFHNYITKPFTVESFMKHLMLLIKDTPELI